MMAGKLAGVPHRIHTYAGLIFPTSKSLKKYLLWSTDWITCYCSTISIPEGAGVKKDLINSRINFRNLNLIANGSLCGIDPDYYLKTDSIVNEAQRIKAKYKIKSNEIVFSFIGRIVKDKGIEELVNAFLMLIAHEKLSAHLLIAGDFDDNLYPVDPIVENAIKHNPSIHWLGFVNDVRPVFVASDVFVLPSYREGFPNVVLQSCALEVATIVTDINGSNEIIQNEVNGLVVPSANTIELFSAMRELYHSPHKRSEFGRVSRKHVVENFNNQLIWTGLSELYRSLN
jgi:glycosyltransferase involved in cell wall biosynthesis